MADALANVCYRGEDRTWDAPAAMSQFDPQPTSKADFSCSAHCRIPRDAPCCFDGRVKSQDKVREEAMKRREFITLLGGAVVSSGLQPYVSRAQPSSKAPKIGYLGAGTPAGQGDWAAAFAQRLRELGWIEGRNIAIEYRWAENRPERYTEIAAEFVRLKVDVIATVGIAVPAVKRVTSVIPIIFAVDADPVGGGLV